MMIVRSIPWSSTLIVAGRMRGLLLLLLLFLRMAVARSAAAAAATGATAPLSADMVRMIAR